MNDQAIYAMRGALESLEYLDRTYPNLTGYAVRAQRMDDLRAVLAECGSPCAAPTESIESPEFRAMLYKWAASDGNVKRYTALIAHINAWSDERTNRAINQTIQSVAKVVREEALNEAADECERMRMFSGARQESPAHNDVWAAAKAIRALATKKERANG